MRFLAIGILATGLAASGCHAGAGTPAANATTDGAPASAAVGGTAPAETEVIVPIGTTIPIVLDTPVGSATSRVEEPVSAHVANAVMVNGVAVIPEGTAVRGVVTDATRSGRVKGRAHVSLRFDSIVPADGDTYRIDTTAVGRTAQSTTDKDAFDVAAPAVGGAIIGGLLGGGKGAAIGAAAGGGGGAAVVLSTRGKEVRIGAGARLTLKLREPLTVKIRG